MYGCGAADIQGQLGWGKSGEGQGQTKTLQQVELMRQGWMKSGHWSCQSKGGAGNHRGSRAPH